MFCKPCQYSCAAQAACIPCLPCLDTQHHAYNAEFTAGNCWLCYCAVLHTALTDDVCTQGCPVFSHLTLTGGAIGSGPPMAVGAAIACPHRWVINLQVQTKCSILWDTVTCMCRMNACTFSCICHIILRAWGCVSTP